VSPQLLPDAALLDGDLTLSVPPATTAYTGIDAMCHALEAMTSRHKKNPVSDVLARQALTLLGDNIRTVCGSPDAPGFRQARAAMLLGSTLAGMAFANAPVAAVHALAYPVGSHFGVPHGLSNALMLPHVIRFNSEDAAAAATYAEVCDILFPDWKRWKSDLHGAAALADGFAELAEELGIATTLGEVGIADTDVDLLSIEALKQTRLLPNNPREVRLDDALALYRAAL
jgi:alcohol dehydrogenase class IV